MIFSSLYSKSKIENLYSKVKIVVLAIIVVNFLAVLFSSSSAFANAKASYIEDGPAVKNKSFFNIKDYGAKGNGKTIDTEAINKAIDAAAESGGGTVLFPAGTYLSGSIQLESNISLYLEQGATLQAVFDTSAYNKPESFEGPQYQDFGHTHFQNSLIW